MRNMPDRPDQEAQSGTGEFHRIATYFAPLAAGNDGALGLKDDAALIRPPPGRDLVVTADTLVETVHFVGDETPSDIARKSLRTNLSDLAAMGAEPMGYFLSLSLPKRIGEDWIAGFCDGLAADQAEFGLSLLGGDSTSTPGPISIAITAMGSVEAGKALKRSGAQVGDGIFVSGTIGDGFLGLLAAQGRLPPSMETESLRRRYLLPQPRIALGRALVGAAHAAMDVSDGLIADMAHICAASGVGADISAPSVPVSDAAGEQVADNPDLFADMLTGGDDYELLITGPEQAIRDAAACCDTPVTRIGSIVAGSGVTVRDSDGAPLTFLQTGFRHS